MQLSFAFISGMMQNECGVMSGVSGCPASDLSKKSRSYQAQGRTWKLLKQHAEHLAVAGLWDVLHKQNLVDEHVLPNSDIWRLQVGVLCIWRII